MSQTFLNQESKLLVVSAIACLVIGGAGIVFSWLSSSDAILLDGLFNLTYFVTGLFTLKVAQLVRQGDDEHFPFGYAFFEPLINGIKGVLVLGVSMMAFFDALQAILEGGRAIQAGIAIVYGVLASVGGWLVAIIMRLGAKRTGSPLVRADAENWLLNGAISSAVLLAFIGIHLIEGTELEHLAPYVDPSLVVLVVLMCVAVPVRMAWTAIMQLLSRASPPDVVNEVRRIIEESTSMLPVEEVFVRVTQPGRTLMVLAHVILPRDYQLPQLVELDGIRNKTLDALRAAHSTIVLDMMFTADREWGAPSSPKTKSVA